jgi:hypothetical protein
MNSPPDCLCPGSGLDNELGQCNAAGQAVLQLTTPWRDGTTHMVLLLPEFMPQLAAPQPLPRAPIRPLVGRSVRTAALRRPIQHSECQHWVEGRRPPRGGQ